MLNQPASPGLRKVLSGVAVAGRAPVLIATVVQKYGAGGDVEAR
jgi:hypothetical protein